MQNLDDGIAVKVISFCEIIESLQETVALMKMDIEGSEYEILEQTPHVVWSKIDAIGIELHEGDQPHCREEFLNRMSSLGFPLHVDAFSTLFASRTLPVVL